MRLVTFELATPLGPAQRLGLWRPDAILDLNLAFTGVLARSADRVYAVAYAAVVLPPDMLGFLRAGEAGREAAADLAGRWQAEGELPGPHGERTAFAPDMVKLLAPLPRPNTLRDFSTFEQHQQRVTRAKGSSTVPEVWYELPVYWKANPENVIGPEADVVWPAYSERLDFELEFGVVIGRTGRDIPVERADEYIAGYTIFNDISARDRQARETVMTFGPAKGKDFDNSKVLGPALVTPDEFGPGEHRMTARINGEIWSEGLTSAMYWSFADLIAYSSQGETLRPGDFFGSGACGSGCGLELDRWIQPGDVIELEVEGLGRLRNRVVRPGEERRV
jgi:2-keto-4-pentenoate hydratase/2-oxohepta-3-ene-1,7-dioic acid hydratase in catechol pathway